MAGPGTKLSRHGAHLASCATKFAQHGAFTGSPATKFAQRSPYYGVFAKKLARQAIKRHFWGIFRALGELFRAHTHHQTKQGELCTARGAGVGTKLSRLAASANPTGTKLSQHAQKHRNPAISREQGELSPASNTNPPLTRYKTLPATAAPWPDRYKTLPTRPPQGSPGTKLSPQQPPPGPTGTKLSQYAQKHQNPAISSAQGEFSPASNTTPPSRENFLPLPTPIHHSPGTKLSQQQPPPGSTGTKLSPQQPPRAQPVQNSPGTPKNTEIRPFLASRENFLPVPTPRHRAGRIFSRFQHHLGAYFNAADRLVPTFTQAPDQCAPELGIVRVIGCSSRCSSRTRRD